MLDVYRQPRRIARALSPAVAEGAGEPVDVLGPRAAASAHECGAEFTPAHRVLEVRVRIDVEDEF